MRLVDVFARVFSEPAENLSESINTINFRKWDSLAHVELLLAIEEAYGITFSGSEVPILTSFKAIKEVLKRKGVALEETELVS